MEKVDESFLIGSDPEVFITLENNIISADRLFPDSNRDNPIYNDGIISIHRDNALLEYTHNPVSNIDDWVKIHDRALSIIRNEILDPKYFSISPLQEAKVIDVTDYEIGCIEDECIYKGYCGVDKFIDETRTAGGHIHISRKDINTRSKNIIIKMLDIELSIKAILENREPLNSRRQLYGKAGTYRYKKNKNILEYRTPSNYWIFTEKDRRWVFEKVKYVLQNYKKFESDIPEIVIQDTINNFNKEVKKEYGIIT